MKTNLYCRASVLAVVVALAATGTAAAQQRKPAAPPAADEEKEVSSVIITGSFLRGKEETALPVDVVGTEELSQRGAPTMVQFVKTIPSSGAVLGENNRFGGGNGTSTVNLRNLGSNRTLVLMNGQRIAGSIRSLGGVDLNTLPSNAIARVDVLKDGAAATYGSDAIGGVVNFITRTDLQGFEFTGQYQAISGSDGDYNAGLAWGNKGDRGNVLIAANYRARSQLPVEKRAWALRTGYDGYMQNPLGGWAATGNPGVYNTSASAPVGSPNTGFTSATFAGVLQDIGCAANGGAPVLALGSPTVGTGVCAFQYTTFDNLVENEKNLQLYGEVNFDLTDHVRFHSGVTYATNETPYQSWAVTGPNQWPAPILASGGVNGSPGGGVSPIPAATNAEQSRFYIPNTNPGLIAMAAQIAGATCTGSVLPYGTTAANCASLLTAAQTQATQALLYGVAPSQSSWRPIGFGGSPSSDDMHAHYSYKTTSFRIDGGFKGDFANGIGWQTSAIYQNLKYDATLNDIAVNRLQLALAGFGSRSTDSATNQCTAAKTANFTANAGNAALGCYYFNPFTNGFATTQSGDRSNPFYQASSTTIAGFNDAVANRKTVAAWMQQDQPNHNTTEMFVADAVFNGEIPFKLWADAKPSWAAGAQYRYDRIIDAPEAVYSAVATPCVDSAPFGDNSPSCSAQNGPFLFNASRRPYDVNRKISAGFVEVRLPVTEKFEVTLAGRYENYQGLGSTTNPKVSARWQVADWLALRGSVGSTYRAPPPTSVTSTFNRGLTNANGTYRAVDTYGNPNLRPETADTINGGFVVDYKRLNASVDYWSFDFTDQLTTEATADLIAIMFPGGTNDTGARCGVAAYSEIQARFTFFGNVCGRGNIQSYRTNNINGGKIKTSGLDFQLNYDVGEAFGVDIKTGIDGSYLLKYDESPYTFLGTTIPSSSVATVARAGTYRASVFTGYNRVRANAFINLTRGPHNLRWQMRFISAIRQSEATPLGLALSFNASPQIPSYVQHDITYRVDLPSWGGGTQLTLGVQNVLGTDPPFAFATQYNYDPGSANPLGRVYTVGLKKKF